MAKKIKKRPEVVVDQFGTTIGMRFVRQAEIVALVNGKQASRLVKAMLADVLEKKPSLSGALEEVLSALSKHPDAEVHIPTFFGGVRFEQDPDAYEEWNQEQQRMWKAARLADA